MWRKISLVDCCMAFLVVVLVFRYWIVVSVDATVDIIRSLFSLLVIVMVITVGVTLEVLVAVVALVAAD
jgi:hypothetical protein